MGTGVQDQRLGSVLSSPGAQGPNPEATVIALSPQGPTGTPRKWVEMQQVLICPEKLPGYIWKHPLFMPLLYLLLQGTPLSGP